MSKRLDCGAAAHRLGTSVVQGCIGWIVLWCHQLGCHMIGGD